MTLNDARRALPEAATDGDGAILVRVELSAEDWTVVDAGEENEQAIDWSRTVQYVQTFAPAFYTSEGARVGSLVVDVERLYGKTTEIVLSKIESRQFIEFERQPRWVGFRFEGGIFPRNSRRTTAFVEGARIGAISVSEPPDF